MAATAKRQGELEGFERPSDPEIDEEAVKYIAVRTQRAELQAKERMIKESLRAKMKARGWTKYPFLDGEIEREVVVAEKETIKVQLVSDEDDE